MTRTRKKQIRTSKKNEKAKEKKRKEKKTIQSDSDYFELPVPPPFQWIPPSPAK